jgi:hypothetical protein
MKTKILLFYISLFLLNTNKIHAQVNVQDSLALIDYYDSTHGVTPWQFGQSWDLQNPVGTWSGIGISNNRVVSIRLWGGGGAGAIPSSFGNLTALKSIDFLDNRLTATLPESFDNLISLINVKFHAVFDDFPFPAAITKVPNLTAIDFENNIFTDSIPSSIGGLTNLTSLNLYDNNLLGSIPNSLNKLGFLTSMNISLNRYTFKDLVPFINDYKNANKIYSLTYSPQKNISIHRYNNKMAVSVGGSLNDNTFKWYKYNQLVATINGDSTYTPTEIGTYSVAVTNSVATDLTLYADDFIFIYATPDFTVSTTQNITGTSPVNMSNGIFEIAQVEPISGANQLTGNVTAVVNIDASINTFQGQPYVERHYDITPALNADKAQAIVTLYFTQKDFDNYNSYVTGNNLDLPLLPTGGVDNGNVTIRQLHGSFTGTSQPENYSNQNIIVIIPTSVTWNYLYQSWAVTFPVTGFSGFFVSTGNAVLPLTLLNFSGTVLQNSINLHWLTSDEIATKEFVIERSGNVNVFGGISTVKAQSAQGNKSYNYTDAVPLIGNNFYRLKMIDLDGKFSYSNVLKINFKTIISFLEIFPNPASSFLNIKITSGKKEHIILKVVDVAGKLTTKKALTVNNGITPTSLNIEKLSPGLYFLNTSVDGNLQKIEFIKK